METSFFFEARKYNAFLLAFLASSSFLLHFRLQAILINKPRLNIKKFITVVCLFLQTSGLAFKGWGQNDSARLNNVAVERIRFHLLFKTVSVVETRNFYPAVDLMLCRQKPMTVGRKTCLIWLPRRPPHHCFSHPISSLNLEHFLSDLNSVTKCRFTRHIL